jgi:glycosyltransferase involved in cell wall biosynthesis
MSRKIKICILSELAYSLISGKGIRGGAELQMTILTKELVRRSYNVSFVTFEKSGSSNEVIDGINVYNPFNNQNKGSTYLFPQNIYKLLKTLKKIDADIYIQRAASPLTGFISFFSKLNNKIFLYSASSDNDVSTYLSLKSIKDLKNLFFRYGVKHSNMVICQTNHQKNLLKQILDINGKVIKNFFPLPKIIKKKKPSSVKILWTGRMRKEKRPDLYLNLAKSFPDFKFLMIGGPSSVHPEFYDEIKESAKKVKNLDFIGFVPHNQMEKYYTESMLLINTSSNEGFPNTFLEAWGYCIPVVSLGFDPDEIICKNKLGFHSKTFDQLIEDIKTLIKNDQLRAEIGANAKIYIENEHNVTKLANEYEQLFEFLVLKRRYRYIQYCKNQLK